MIDQQFAAAVRGPVYYISATAWNALGLRHWLADLHFLTAADYCDGHLPGLAHPARLEPGDLDTIEASNTRILTDPDVRRYIRERGADGRALLLMFDEHNEAALRAAPLALNFPSCADRNALDDKIATTRLATEADVRSVPNALGRVTDYASLRALASELGPDVVVQLPFGDSGRTTFFISTEADFLAHADAIAAVPEVKVMRRIRCRPSAIEGCVTRHGTVVGPLVTELVGFPELTPYRGGWCGNELVPEAFTPAILDEATAITRRIGDQLATRGYRGIFGLDFLLDEASGDLYLGELNPRVTGVTPLTTQAARDLGLPPLLVLHLLEYQDWEGAPIPDVTELTRAFRKLEGAGVWSQLIIKETHGAPAGAVPASGIWSLDGHARSVFDTSALASEHEAMVLRTIGPDDVRDKGTVIARLMGRGRMMNASYELEPRARRWISSVRACF